MGFLKGEAIRFGLNHFKIWSNWLRPKLGMHQLRKSYEIVMRNIDMQAESAVPITVTPFLKKISALKLWTRCLSSSGSRGDVKEKTYAGDSNIFCLIWQNVCQEKYGCDDGENAIRKFFKKHHVEINKIKCWEHNGN